MVQSICWSVGVEREKETAAELPEKSRGILRRSRRIEDSSGWRLCSRPCLLGAGRPVACQEVLYFWQGLETRTLGRTHSCHRESHAFCGERAGVQLSVDMDISTFLGQNSSEINKSSARSTCHLEPSSLDILQSFRSSRIPNDLLTSTAHSSCTAPPGLEPKPFTHSQRQNATPLSFLDISPPSSLTDSQ